jgi:hypothetical protein
MFWGSQMASYSAFPARAASDLRRAWTFASRFCRTVSATSQRYAGATIGVLRRGTFQLLGPVETALLNPVRRDRIHATATFALIFLFAVASVDFLISGGPEFGAPARAAPQQRLVRVSPPPSAVDVAAPVVADEPAPTALSSALEEAREANVVALSQAFVAAAPEISSETEAPAAVTAQAGEADDPLSGAANDPSAAAEEASPRKRTRVKGEPAEEPAAN